MRLLSRYVLRLHVAPFLFGLSALVMLMLLDQLAKKFRHLVGKGLEWTVITQVFLLSIPFILAVIVPMAVLVAVLYTFNRLAADNEISAMKANGVSLARITAPVFVAATFVAVGMVWFNDTVLPEANHRLRVLYSSIHRKKPTFQLRERWVNEVIDDRLFIQAARIDNATSQLEDVTIWDLRDIERSRTIYADSGLMASNESQTDLYLTLFDGVFHDERREDPESFQRAWFKVDYFRVPDVGNELDLEERGYRSDRELPIDSMLVKAAENRRLAAEVEKVSRTLSASLVSHRLGALAPDDVMPDDTAAAVAGAWSTGERLTSPSSATTAFRTQGLQYRRYNEEANRFEVEIWKKFSIPAACIVFVLIGAPIAVRYRRGGVGLVVGVSLAVYCLYYVALIGGEHLADKRLVSPFWAMWSPNLLFGGVGIIAFFRARRAGG
jgi:lipopolysaccharide export system permease protein